MTPEKTLEKYITTFGSEPPFSIYGFYPDTKLAVKLMQKAIDNKKALENSDIPEPRKDVEY